MARNVNITFNADLKDFDSAMAHFRQQMGMVENVSTQTARNVGDNFGKMGQLLGGYLSARAIADFGRQVVTVRGQFQVLENGFKTMLGSEKEATKLMEQLMETATKTTFDLQGVASGAKSLLAYGESAETVNDTLVRLSDIASGLSIPLNDLVYLYGTTMTQGRVFTQDIRQFMGRGIPIIEELAKVMSVSKDEVSALVTAGKVGFPEIQKALQNMTNEGGKFYKMSESSTKSLTGAISNLQDSFSQMLNEIGKGIEGEASQLISFTSTLIENYKKIGAVLAGLITAYGTYKAAMVALNIANQARQFGNLLDVIKRLTIAQKLLNSAVMKNPYIALASVLVGLGATLIGIVKTSGDLEKVTGEVAKAHEKLNQEIEKNKELVRDEIVAIKEQTATYEEQMETLSKLRALKGNENLSLDDIKKMSNEEVESLTQRAQLQEERNRLEQERKKWTQAQTMRELGQKGQLQGDWKQSRSVRTLFEDWKKSQEGYFYSASDFSLYVDTQVKELEKALEVVEKQEQQFEKKVLEDAKKPQNYAYWEKQYQEAETARKAIETKDGAIADRKEFQRLTAVMRDAQKMMDLYKDKTKETGKAQNDFNERLRELRELTYSTMLDKEEGTYLGNIEAIKASYNRNLEELNQMREDDKKKGYNEEQIKVLNAYYDKVSENYLQQMKESLEANEKIYRDWLADFNATINEEIETELEKSNREIEQRANEMRAKAQAMAKNETEMSENVSKISSWEVREKENVQVQYLISKENELLKKEIERLDINEAIIGEEETAEKKLEAQRESILRKISLLEEQKELSEKEKEQIEDYRLELQGVENQLEEINNKVRQQVSLYNSIGGALSNMGQSISSLGGEFEELGSLFESLGSSMNQFSEIYEKTDGFKTDMSFSDKASAIASGASTIIDLVASAGQQVQENRAMQEQWNQSIKDGVHEMNLLKLNSMDIEPTNIFGIEDNSQGLKDSVAKFKETRKILDEYSKELSKGKVQTGTEKGFEWATLGKHVVAGAAAGTAIGSFAGPFAWIGTIAGAVVGTVTGIVDGLKEIPVFESLRDVYGEIYNNETYELNQKIIADYDKMDDATKKMIDNWDEIKMKMEEADAELEEYIKKLTGELGQEISDILMNAFRNDNITSAIDGITDYLIEKLENIVHQQIFASVFQKDFENLTSSLKLSAESGDIVPDLISGVAQIKSNVNKYMKLTKDVQTEFEKMGIKLWEEAEEATEQALSGSGMKLTAEEVKESNGNFMGLKFTAMEINSNVAGMKAIAQTHNDLLRSNQNALMAIVTNTSHLQYIRDDIANMNRKGILLR